MNINLFLMNDDLFLIKSFLVEGRIGQLNIEYDDYKIDKEFTFKEGALSISGVDIKAISSHETHQKNSEPPPISGFEKHLLDGPHSYTRKDVKELASKYGFRKAYNESFTIVFFLRDPEERWFIISSTDEKSFVFTIWRGYSGDISSESWKIKVGPKDDSFVRALEYVCRAAEAINNGELPKFILKMRLIFPQ